MTMIQIRNVPEDVHRTLKSRAASEGMSLFDYLLREISSIAARPTAAELWARIERRGRPSKKLDSARAVRREREGRR